MTTLNTVTVQTTVPADPATAFSIFTLKVDQWWKRGPRYRLRDDPLRFEGEFLLEGEEPIGKILESKPGDRLLFELWTWSFREEEKSRVEVKFQPTAQGTQVTVTHTAWQDRPGGEAEFRTVVGLWWGGLITAYRSASQIS